MMSNLNNVPFRINWINLFFSIHINVSPIPEIQQSIPERSLGGKLIKMVFFNHCMHNLGNLCRSYLIMTTGGNMTVRVCLCVFVHVCWWWDSDTLLHTDMHVVGWCVLSRRCKIKQNLGLNSVNLKSVLVHLNLACVWTNCGNDVSGMFCIFVSIWNQRT